MCEECLKVFDEKYFLRENPKLKINQINEL